MKRSYFYYLTHPSVGIPALLAKVSVRYAIKQQWNELMNYPLNLANPQSYNEKLQWLKLYDHNPLYTTLVDKYRVKAWVADKIGPQYVIPTLAVWQRADDVDIKSFPNQFVLKCNHDSGSVIICKDKATFDLNAAKELLRNSLKKNFYYAGWEWPYKKVKPCVFAESYMEDGITHDLRDYKFFCFDGIVKAAFVATDRQSTTEETKFDFFDVNYRHLDVTNGHPNTPPSLIPPKPNEWEEMVRIAELLSDGIPHVRCDLYCINGKIYFGEMTFYHWGGFKPFNPQKWDYIFGDWLTLPKNI